MRTIIRFSTDGESDNKLGLKLRASLKKNKIALSPSTGTYEKKLSVKKIASCMKDFWDTAADYKGPGSVDHFWMYVDKPQKAKNKAKTTASANTGISPLRPQKRGLRSR